MLVLANPNPNPWAAAAASPPPRAAAGLGLRLGLRLGLGLGLGFGVRVGVRISPNVSPNAKVRGPTHPRAVAHKAAAPAGTGGAGSGYSCGCRCRCECSAARLAQGRLIARQPRLARAPAVLGRLINRLTSMTKCRLMTIRRLVIRRRALDYVSNGARLRPADWQARRVLGGRVGRS